MKKIPVKIEQKMETKNKKIFSSIFSSILLQYWSENWTLNWRNLWRKIEVLRNLQFFVQFSLQFWNYLIKNSKSRIEKLRKILRKKLKKISSKIENSSNLFTFFVNSESGRKRKKNKSFFNEFSSIFHKSSWRSHFLGISPNCLASSHVV